MTHVAGLRGRLRSAEDDGGFGLVEALIAIVVFALMSGGVIAGLLVAQQQQYVNRQRIAASSIAAQEMDRARAIAAGDKRAISQDDAANGIAQGRSTVSYASNGTVFTVQRDAVWLTKTGTTTACNGTSARSYLSFSVAVTWPEMRSAKPVRSSTVITPRVGTIDETKGSLSVTVLSATGAKVPNVNVALNTTNVQTTTERGCVLFPFLAAGGYSLSASGSGLVNKDGLAQPTSLVSITGAVTTNAEFQLDKAGTLALTPLRNALYPLPPELAKVTVANPGMSAGKVTTTLPSAAPTDPPPTATVPNLFPFIDGYYASLGPCAPTTQRLDLQPGAVAPSALSVHQAALKLVSSSSGAPLTGRTITLLRVADTNCSAFTATLGLTDATGTVRATLPTGSWKVYVNGVAAAPVLSTTAGAVPLAQTVAYP